MLVERYAKTRPYLYHLTHKDNILHLCAMGCILPASMLMLRAGRTDLLRARRRNSVAVTIDGRVIMLRDQKPLHKGSMQLPNGLTFEQFVEVLNSRIFFWPGAYEGPISYGVRHYGRYKTEGPAILRIRLESLLEANPSCKPLFCRYNSGSPRCFSAQKSPRSHRTFMSSEEFQEPPSAVVEVTFEQELSLPSDVQFGWHPSGPWKKLV